jgi:hypothetical protein
MRAFAALAFALALALGSAAAAPPKKAAPLLEPPMQVHVVRSGHPGCEPKCLEWIAAQGRIVSGTLGQFKAAIKRLDNRKVPIFIDSGGGAVNEALAIGRLIRAKGLAVAVTRTVFAPCQPRDAACRKAKAGGELRGLAQAGSARCASSCAFLLAGGTSRFVGPGTGVGVHRITMMLRRYLISRRLSYGGRVKTRKTLVSERRVGESHAQTRSTYASIRQYLAEMGIGDGLMPIVLSTPSDAVRWLTPAELQATRLATHFITGEQLATGAAPPAPPPVPAAAAPNTAGFEGCGKIGELSVGCNVKTWLDETKSGAPVAAPTPSPAELPR